jgi:peptidoglycan/xylan/chitin deacetylase (PgdA/CDA1 family)
VNAAALTAQTITVSTHAPASATNGSSFPVAATASSNLPVDITATGGCTISSGTVTMNSDTTACVVHYNQAGNATYSAAPEITETTNVSVAAGADCSTVVTASEILNPCLEDGTTWDGTNGGPDNWYLVQEGVVGGGTYPAATWHSGTKAAEVHVNSITGASTDPHYVQWGFNPVTVDQNSNYQFSFWYNSNADGEADIEYDTANGAVYAQLRSNLPSTGGTWKQFSTNIVTPPGTQAISVAVLVSKAGSSLTIDDFSLVKNTTFASAFSAGMVSLNFDDGLSSFWDYATSTLNAAGLKATEYIITGSDGSNVISSTPNGGFLSKAQILALSAAGYDIGDHTASHADLTTVANLSTEINDSVTALHNAGIATVNTIAYPYGAYNSAVETQSQNVPLLAARSVDDGFNDILTDKYALKIKEVFNTTSVSDVEGWIDAANATHTWLILLFHSVEKDADGLDCTTPDANNPQECVSVANLQAIANYLNSTHTNTVTMSEGIAVMNGGSIPQQNQAPVLNAIADQAASVGTQLAFTATATDANNDALTYSLTGSTPVGASITSAGAFTWTPTADQAGATTTTVTVDDGHGGTASQVVNITVGKPSLTVHAINQSMIFGAAEPTYTFWYSGFTGTDATSSVETAPTCAVAGEHAAVGTYAITCSGAADTDDFYSFAYTDGTLTVSPVDGTVVLSNLEQVYDGTPKAVATSTGAIVLSVSVSYEGTGDTTYPLSNTAPTDAGTYHVIATIDPGQGYSGTAEGTLTISKTATEGADTLNQTIDVVQGSTDNPITLGTLDAIAAPAWTIVTSPANGIFGGTAPAVTYTPNAASGDWLGYGTDVFTFKVGDANHESGIATINIIVHPAPVAQYDHTYTCDQGTLSDAHECVGEDTTTTAPPTMVCDTANGFELVDNQCVNNTDPENVITADPTLTCDTGATLNGENMCETTTPGEDYGPATDTATLTDYACPTGWHYSDTSCEAGALYTITASAGEHGSISPSGDVQVLEHGSQSFAFSADSGYHVSDVLVDGSSVGAVNHYDFSDVIAAHTVSVSFAQDQSNNNGGGGGCSGCGCGGCGGGGGGGVIGGGSLSIGYVNSSSSGSGGLVLGASTQALTDQQINAILDLLRSFNADQSVIDSVNKALHGQSSTGSTSGFIFTLTLQTGSTGNEVTELQKRLTAEGVYTGPITGYFGALTKAGVIAYQKKNGIDQVGIVGPQTRAALNK